MRLGGAVTEIDEYGEQACCPYMPEEEDCDCWEYGYDWCVESHVPDHCCDCGGSPYCQCCGKCGAACLGSCRCSVTVQLQDGGSLELGPVKS